MFRVLPLPQGVAGKVYLHSMPGRAEPLDRAVEQIDALGIQRVVSLAPLEQIRRDSPHYALLIESGVTPWIQELLPVPDFGIPADEDAYLAFFRNLSRRVRAGERVLLHCAAGIGRTGMGAVTLLLCLGQDLDTATRTVLQAGSGAEEPEQHALLERLADRVAGQD